MKHMRITVEGTLTEGFGGIDAALSTIATNDASAHVVVPE
jgi:hypothetical protein